MSNCVSKSVLVINCGSSSVKFAIMNPEDGQVYLSGIAEAMNLPEAFISWRFGDSDKQKAEISGYNHEQALSYLVDNILSTDKQLLESIVACGHRIVHGGEYYSAPTLIDDEVLKNIEKVIPFAPLHNPAHILGINAARASFPNIPHVAVFDTAFHQTMPPVAYRFAIPEEYYTKGGIRRYGAHGTSHMYLAQEAARLLGKKPEDTNVITCHLGGGASVCAVKGGKCMDTSMGLTPLDGLIMGTRTGEIDPSVVFFLCDPKNDGLTVEEVKDIFNKKSGLLGLSGISSDMRPICEGYEKGEEKCTLALEAFSYRLAKFIASYFVPVGRVDAIVFSGGIGENCWEARKLTIDYLKDCFGIELDNDVNLKALGRLGFEGGLISTPESKIPVMMIPTNEELVIAQSAVKFTK
ncbi:MAG: acetate kinase [Anaerobiospirillum succiniciproducens]|uniref:acetate kinase n=1 Tax=Anaerobiospirillum succiniciproducens TaxID=13335 RepID=UPI002353C3E7|nr:acetate kinase [Anaerobiospirillum succiniciproducens]MCI6864286.1 acetate kinase [Anaerobiospirillum succiniciproducens]MDO4675451.1 acetate kinase [Anaerobiospirillum succiniciproducens]MDY2799024.1 acetate kinase [Anaerobiospirillum succiniciproducens]